MVFVAAVDNVVSADVVGVGLAVHSHLVQPLASMTRTKSKPCTHSRLHATGPQAGVVFGSAAVVVDLSTHSHFLQP